jgi:hypothetical protein
MPSAGKPSGRESEGKEYQIPRSRCNKRKERSLGMEISRRIWLQRGEKKTLRTHLICRDSFFASVNRSL